MSNSKHSTFFNLFKIILALIILGSIFLVIKDNRQIIEKPIIHVSSNKVFNNMKDRFKDVNRIRITIPDGSFNINKNQNIWQIAERDNYPASPKMVEEFANKIINLEKGQLVSQDPGQFDTHGVGEPMEFGFGTVVEFFDPQDQLISASHIGSENGHVFVRKIGEGDTYSAKGEFLKIDDIALWPDYEIINFKAQDIAKINYILAGAKPIILTPDIDGNYNYDGAKSPIINQLANFIFTASKNDVTKNSRINSNPISTTHFYLKNGDELIVSYHKQFKKHWLKFNIISQNNSQFADFTNSKANDWAYAIDSQSAKLLSLNAIQLKNISTTIQ